MGASSVSWRSEIRIVAWLIAEQLLDGSSNIVAIEMDTGSVRQLTSPMPAGCPSAVDGAHGIIFIAQQAPVPAITRMCLQSGLVSSMALPTEIVGAVVHLDMAPSGTRLAMECRGDDGVRRVYVFAIKQDAGSFNLEILVGNQLPNGLGLRTPVFLGSDRRILCVAETAPDVYACAMLSSGRMGDSGHIAPGSGTAARLQMIATDTPVDAACSPVVDATGTRVWLSSGSDSKVGGLLFLDVPSRKTVTVPLNLLGTYVLPGSRVYQSMLFSLDGYVLHAADGVTNMVCRLKADDSILSLINGPKSDEWVYTVDTPDGLEYRTINTHAGTHVTILRTARQQGHKVLAVAPLTEAMSATFKSLGAFAAVNEVGAAISLDLTVATPLQALIAPGEVLARPADDARVAGDLLSLESVGGDASLEDPFDSGLDMTEAQVGLGDMFEIPEKVSQPIEPVENSTDGVESSPSDVDGEYHGGEQQVAGVVSGEGMPAGDDETVELDAQKPFDASEDVTASEADELEQTSEHSEPPATQDLPVTRTDLLRPKADDVSQQKVTDSIPELVEGMDSGATAKVALVASVDGEEPAAASEVIMSSGTAGAPAGAPDISERRDSDNDVDVWTSAPMAMSPPDVGGKPAVTLPSSDKLRAIQRPTESVDSPQSDTAGGGGVSQSEPRPDIDFSGWIRLLESVEEPLVTLEELNRYTGDLAVRLAAADHLKSVFGTEDAQPNQIIFATAACAHLRCDQVREDLVALCQRAYDRVVHSGDIPEAEEHFAMAAIRALDMPRARFSSTAVYDEYEAVVAQATKILDRDGEAAARKLLRALAKRYKSALANLLGRPKAEQKKDKADSKKETKRTKGKRVDLMEGYEFPNVDDVMPEEAPPPDISSSFQPFMSTTGNHPIVTQAPVRDEASIDLFQVDLSANETPSVSETGFRAEMSMPASGTVRTILLGSGVLGILAGLLLGILGIRISPLLSVAGAFWLFGGIGLVGGKPGGWRFGLSAYLLAGLVVALFPIFGTLPQHILPVGMYFIGALSIGLGAGLTHSSIRKQMGRRSPFA